MGREEVERKLAAMRAAQQHAELIQPKPPDELRWSPLDWARSLACSLQPGKPMLIGRDKAGKAVMAETPVFFDTLVDMQTLLHSPLNEDDIDHLAWLEALAVFQRTSGFVIERYALRHGHQPPVDGSSLREADPPLPP